MSQRDVRMLALLRSRIDPGCEPPADLRDHHESAWVLEHLPEPPPRA